MISTYIIPGLQCKLPEPFNHAKEMKILACRIFNVDEARLFTKTRKREVVAARQAYAAALYEIEGWGPSRIAGSFDGGKNHATVIHSIKTVSNMVDTDRSYRTNFAMLIKAYKKAYTEHRNETITAARILGLVKEESEISPSEPRSNPEEHEDTSTSTRVEHALTLVA